MMLRKSGLLLFATAFFVCLQIAAASACVTPRGCDRVTGGGQVVAASGFAGTYSVEGGVLHGAFWGGHSTFLDHGNGFFMQGDGVVTGYTTSFIGPTFRVITGLADVRLHTGAPLLEGYSYRIVVADNGEPGIGRDSYSLQVYNPAHVVIYQTRQATNAVNAPRIVTGNIQLHVQMNCAAMPM